MMKKIRKICILTLSILLVISGIFVYKIASFAHSPGMSKEEIHESFAEYVESTYGPGVDFRIVSYGDSGIGYINRETGEVVLHIEDMGIRGWTYYIRELLK